MERLEQKRLHFLQDQQSYLNHYHLSTIAEYEQTVLRVEQIDVIVHWFTPESYDNTLVFIHGYMDHSGAQAPFFTKAVEHGLRVVAIDLPGHGLSSGDRYAVRSFDIYDQMLGILLEQIQTENRKRPFLLGHSTGGGIIAHYILKRNNPYVLHPILVSPLVRTMSSLFMKVGQPLVQLTSEEVPRKFRHNTGDGHFAMMQQQDPLQSDRIPIAWVKEMLSWEKKFLFNQPSQKAVSIIQGTADKTVDWKHNLSVYKQKFPRANPILIEHGEHQLLNEVSPIREMTYSRIFHIVWQFQQ
ncbi:alpha/beta hydrolase [Geomicrobium sediminis]|uniref:Alpha-beta hydrolase superfamily lysophospholipase n=1 Tax=Geomicrobium sediminis TaxID=1347788 RepID=A0ABS2PIE2_9BACL|nr:alpha/beta hydrolase [Geomicrobium sediminis]MBM7634795.1 alpha-beta hydrolase superfamily lysophospholipase [Geomicrobium sediminis]